MLYVTRKWTVSLWYYRETRRTPILNKGLYTNNLIESVGTGAPGAVPLDGALRWIYGVSWKCVAMHKQLNTQLQDYTEDRQSDGTECIVNNSTRV